jgi:hypothetical protein
MKRLAGLSVLTVLVLGLTLPAQEGTPAGHPYYPLKVQSEWTYKVQGGPIKVKVTGTEKLKDTTVYKLETSAGNKVSATESVGITNEGVARFNVNNLSPDTPILFLPKDPEATKEWNIDTKVANQPIKGTFKVSKEKVTVPAGSYDTIYVKGSEMEIGGTRTSVEYWFAKDIGIVKLRFSLGSQDATLELESYTPGK